MALRWIEGFEVRQHSDYYSRLYTYAGIALTAAVGGRKHGSAWQGSNSSLTTPVLVGSFQNTWVVQFAFRKINSNAFGGTPGLTFFRGSGNDQFEMAFIDAPTPDEGDFQIELRRGATVLATSPVLAWGNSAKAWHVFQLKVTLDAVSGAYELRHWDYLDNQSTIIAAATSQNTANTGSAGADIIRIRTGTASGANNHIDDIVFWDDSGSGLTDFTANPLLVYGELPNADVAGEIDFVPSTGGTNFVLVDDGATLPNETGEVTSETVGDVDLYGFTQSDLDLIPGSPTVHGVMVNIEAQMKNSGSRTLRVRFKDSTNQADDTTDLVFSTTGRTSLSAIVLQNPTGTPAAWDVATLKTIELGPKVTA